MRVKSPLADIDFNVGRLKLSRGQLEVHSDATSSLDTTIFVTPADARATLKKCVGSGAFWRFMLTGPWLSRQGNSGGANEDDWDKRRQDTGLNKPW